MAHSNYGAATEAPNDHNMSTIEGLGRTLGNHLRRLEEICNSAEGAADRLAGSQPSKLSGPALGLHAVEVPSNGYIDGLARDLRRMDVMVSQLFVSHQRISQALSD